MGDRRPSPGWLPLLGFGVLAAAFYAATYQVLDDHFDRLSRARQIVQFGELPFRDFFDPGYFLSLFVSGALQRVLGDHLAGELLLNSACVGVGAALVLLLARRASGRYLVAVPAAAMAVLALPRAYDYDKFLFYPLGLACCWAYAARPTAGRIGAVAVALVAAALFRYDSGVYIACAALAMLAVVHAGEWRLFSRRAGQLVGVYLVAASPFLVFVQMTSGIGDAIDQIVTYAERERERTSNRPALTDAGLFALVPAAPVPGPPIQVQWSDLAGDAARTVLEARFHLTNPRPAGPAESRWWGYRLGEPSGDNIRRLIESPAVADTRGLDRDRFALERPEPIQVRLERALPPIRVDIPGRRAAAFLYYLLLALPVVAGIVLVRLARTGQATRREVAGMAAVIVMAALLDALVLRDPVSARVGGIAGPAAVLFAWLASQARRVVSRAAMATLVGMSVAALSVVSDWDRRLSPAAFAWSSASQTFDRLSRTPLPAAAMLGERTAALVSYLRACTAPDERVFLGWYAPDVYFFAQRGFAGALPVTFGNHWSDQRFQQRAIAALEAHPPAIVVFQSGRYEGFRGDYRLLGAFMQAHYEVTATTDFGHGSRDEDAYTVLTRRDDRGRRECQTDLVLVAPPPSDPIASKVGSRQSIHLGGIWKRFR